MIRLSVSIRLGAVVAAAVLLAACNVVVTKTPLFSPADETAAAVLRPGVWRFDTDPECHFDDRTKLVSWPECGGGALMKAGDAAFYERKSGEPVLTHQDFVFAAGDPPILQARVSLAGGVTMESLPYIYAGVRATKTDRGGRIVALRFWPVQCGPPPPATADPKQANAGTRDLLPGLTMKPGDPVCTTGSQDALRLAARASETWSPKPLSARWLRDSDRR